MNKNKLKLFIGMIFIFSIISIGIYSLTNKTVSIAAESDDVEVPFEITVPYTYASSSYTRIVWYPIDKLILNLSPDFFCAERGVEYGRHGRKGNNINLGYGHNPNITPFTDHYYNYDKVHSMERIYKHDNPAYGTTGWFAYVADYYMKYGAADYFEPLTSGVFFPYVYNQAGSLTKNPHMLANYATDKFWDYMDYDTENTSTSVETNWYYSDYDVSFDWNTDIWGGNSGNIYSDGSVAFLLACYKSASRTVSETVAYYRKDPLQAVIWAWIQGLGNKGAPAKDRVNDNVSGMQTFENEGEVTSLQRAAVKFIDYYKQSHDAPNVDIIPASNAGAHYDGGDTKVIVGPFDMKKYVDARNFKLLDVDSLQTKFTQQQTEEDEHIGSIIRGKAILTNESGAMSSPINFEIVDENGNLIQSIDHTGAMSTLRAQKGVPDGGAENFYIAFNAGEIENYDELYDIIFVYQRVQASGSGTYYEGSQYTLTYNPIDQEVSDCTYNCTTCKHTGLDYDERSQVATHEYWCGGSGYCSNGYSETISYTTHSGCSYGSYACGKTEHTHDSSCYKKTVDGEEKTFDTPQCKKTAHSHSVSDCGVYHTCSLDCCEHSDSYGDHYVDGHHYDEQCSGVTKCKHFHVNCYKFNWKYGGSSQFGQDAFAGAGVLRDERLEFTINVRIPLKTELEIHKYIDSIKHVGEDITVYSGGEDERKPEDMAWKEENFLKAEIGDLITYKIELENKRRFPLEAQIEDVLPDDCVLVGRDSSDGEAHNYIKITGSYSQEAGWIKIPPKSGGKNGKVVITLEIRPVNSANETTMYENLARFISKNHEEYKVRVTEWGEGALHGAHQYGDIINLTEDEDADYYRIKAYNIAIDKYISSVQHTAPDPDADFASLEKPQQYRSLESLYTEERRENGTYIDGPVPVEVGDTVFYEIVIYNTYDKPEGYGVDRTEDPYFEPEKVYVDIQDTLPPGYISAKYSDTPFTEAGYAFLGQGENFTGEKKNIMVKAGEKTTVYIAVEAGNTSIEKIPNTVQITKIKNINKGPGEDDGDPQFCDVTHLNHSEQIKSTDWYKFKKYSVSVEKFIWDVKHTAEEGEGDETTKAPNDDRKGMAEEAKEGDPVPVEVGDTIFFKIEVSNTTAAGTFPVARANDPYYNPDKVYVNLIDALPNGFQYLDVEEIEYDTGITTCDGENINNLVVPVGKTSYIIIKGVAEYTSADAKEFNTVTLTEVRNINRGTGATAREDRACFVNDYNLPDRTVSKDWYIFKKYNIAVEKYIYDVEHIGEGTDNTKEADDSRKGMEEGAKEAEPVPVEPGDKITYKIVVSNTADSGTFPTAREGAPFYKPDKVYVNLEDTLPNGADLSTAKVVEIEESGYSGSGITSYSDGSSGKITIENFMVPVNGTRTITIETVVKRTSYDAKENNTVEITATRNINRGPSETAEKDEVCLIDDLNQSDRMISRDWHKFKHYYVTVRKYIFDVNHQHDEVTSELDNTFGESTERRPLPEETKKANPVYVEFGDEVIYKIAINNTNNTYDEGVNWEGANFYKPDDIYVDIDDKLPLKCSNVTIEDESGAVLSSEVADGKIKVKEVKVPANQSVEIVVRLTVEEHVKETIEENNAKITRIQNTNICDDPEKCEVYLAPDDSTDALKYNEATYIASSDWYKLNDYNAIVDKYLYKYDEAMLKENNNEGYTGETSITHDDGILNVSRRDWSTIAKQSAPISVEKTEKVVYRVEVRNVAATVAGGITSGVKPATQVRSNVFTEMLEEGLEMRSVTAKLFNGDGSIAIDNIAVGYESQGKETVDGRSVEKYHLTIDKKYVIDPGQYLTYEVEAEIVMSNMYLLDLMNKGELGVLGNINTEKDGGPVRIIVSDEYDENIAPKDDKSEYDYVRLKDLVISGQVWVDLNRNGLLDDSTSNETDMKLYGMNNNAMKKLLVVKLYKVGVTEPIRITRTDENGFYTFSRNIDPAYTTTYYTATGAGTTDYSSSTLYQRVDKATVKDGNGNYSSGSKYIEYYIEFEYDGIVFKSTVYAGKTNINGDGSYNATYPIDSNATEIDSVRKEYNEKYEYISYNATFNEAKSETSALEFIKEGHISQLKEEEEISTDIANAKRPMQARSFVNTGDWSTDYLWLYKNVSLEAPATEYLKHINFGLILSENVDISLTKDVYSVKTTINGEELEYIFNKNEGTNGEGDTANNYVIDEPYDMELFESDYQYRVEQYVSDVVEKYKGIESELNIEVTYKITFTNKSVTDDDLVAGTEDTRFSAKLHEVLDIYDENFIKYNGEATPATITVKERDAAGYLNSKEIPIVEAWYGSENKEEGKKLKVSLSSEYVNRGEELANNVTESGYNYLYISGMDDEYINEGESLDVYIKYVIDKGASEIKVSNEEYIAKESAKPESTLRTETSGEKTVYIKSIQRALKIAERTAKANSKGIENIAQIQAYSIWYTESKLPASLVDMDSNAGNIGIDHTGNKTSVDNDQYYEDNTYKTGVQIWAKNSENEMKIEETPENPKEPKEPKRFFDGMVWDDAKSTTVSDAGEKNVQYIGNGVYNPSDTILENARLNSSAKMFVDNVTLSNEKNDKPILGAKAEFIEIVRTGESSYYEQILKDVTWEQSQNGRTDSNGEYKLSGFVPGKYIIRFTYGELVKDSVAEERSMLVYNGQDYKSVQYNPSRDELTDTYEIIKDLTDTTKRVSDARDDEIRRLEVNSYSEIMYSEKAEILKGLGTDKALDGTDDFVGYDEDRKAAIIEANHKELTDNTYMNAETREFVAKVERFTEDSTGNETTSIDYEERPNEYHYSNIDFGVEYRPESEATLEMAIDEVRLITADRKTIVDLFIKTEYNILSNNEPIIHAIDKEKSYGIEYIQFIANSYAKEERELTTEDIQGLVHMQIDSDILQGCTIEVVYRLVVENASEIDRITETLNAIRYKDNQATGEFVAKINQIFAGDASGEKGIFKFYPTSSEENSGGVESTLSHLITDANSYSNAKNYSPSRTARNALFLEYYCKDKETEQKADGTDRIFRTKEKLYATSDEEGYYGRYVGHTYYAGENVSKEDGKVEYDIVAELKVSKILDYVDPNLEYDLDNVKTYENRFWVIDREVPDAEEDIDKPELMKYIQKVREKINNPNVDNKERVLINSEGNAYKVLVESADDRTVDIDDPNETSQLGTVYNKSLSRFLETSTKYNDDTDEAAANRGKYSAYINLPLSKVVSAESDADDLKFENVAEIVEYVTLNGRRTNFMETIGNIDTSGKTNNERIRLNELKSVINGAYIRDIGGFSGSKSFISAALEIDSAASEAIYLIPPTGIELHRREIVNVMNTAKVGVPIAGIVVGIAVGLIAFIRIIVYKYKKRSIK